jgi:hypothetical protein
MHSRTTLAVALAIAAASPARAAATEESDLAQLRAQIRQMKLEYEARLRALEERLLRAVARTAAQPAGAAGPAPAAAVAATPAGASSDATPAAAPTGNPLAGGSPQAGGAPSAANAFNPAVSLIIGGTYANLSQDPGRYRLQGFFPSGDDAGPGRRGFNLGESELTLSANVDHRFSGALTFSLNQDNAASVEEAFFRANGLAHGVNLTAGRFLSGVGYLNSQHAHAWDFVDAPLAYQAFFGGQYKNDGVQAKWLAPTDQFIELGLEAGRGASFPGNDRNRNGAGAVAAFVHAGDDIGESASWRAGVSYLHNGARARAFDDIDSVGAAVVDAFTGTSGTWIADAIFKWSPNGNSTRTNLKLQGEYFRRTDRGTLTYDTLGQSLGTREAGYRGTQSGWYAQAVYQFLPEWRAGVRYDELYSGTPSLAASDGGALDPASLSRLLAYNPSRATAMLDWSPSEFSRFRLQYARDQARPGVTDHQFFLQYIMSLGVHGAHTF